MNFFMLDLNVLLYLSFTMYRSMGYCYACGEFWWDRYHWV